MSNVDYTKRKGFNNKTEMNDLEKKFLVAFNKDNPNVPIEKNKDTFVIWISNFDNIKNITYTPDFVATFTDSKTGGQWKAYYEVKGWSPNDQQYWELKRRLVENYFKIACISFEEYRYLSGEFLEYHEWKFETHKRSKIKKLEITLAWLNAECLHLENEECGCCDYDHEKKQLHIKRTTTLLNKWTELKYE